ncbi:MAG: 1,4-alpha-glucan branching protein GlgB [Ignavibacteriae bacterium]|nr:MAG: 1,4-alpha-glucan branching protein GlgB [Ignavibacteriota bacterium]
MKSTASADAVQRIIHAEHHDPFSVLGAHVVTVKGKHVVAVRAFLPDTLAVSVVDTATSAEYEMVKITEEGFYEVLLPQYTEVFPYRLKRKVAENRIELFNDPYSFLPTLTDFDLYLFNSGDHHRIYEKLGAHEFEASGIRGVQFAVWAPNAKSVSVVGDFNGWDRRRHAMRVLGASGVWEIFVPGLKEGEIYKFQVKTKSGTIIDKADPYGTEMEQRPKTASKINFLQRHQWNDGSWIQHRTGSDHLGEPISIYEVHLGSWARKTEENNRWLTYREMAERLVAYVLERGYTHIELLPVMEHPLDASWGYQVTGYFAPTSRFGTPQDFMFFVDYCHLNNIGVILDWVPAHFPKDEFALAQFDGTHLYEHADPRKGEHQDWGTYIFNYGRNEVRNFLISNALFWIEQYHIDGLRIDAVASMLYLDYSRKKGEWIPNEYGGRENLDAISFLKDTNNLIRKYFPGVLTIAEESTAYPGVTTDTQYGGLGFSLKWNMGWMHDMLVYFSNDPLFRTYHHNNLTFALLYAFSERFLLPLSHDEVVHGKSSLLHKMPGDDWQKFSNLRLLYGLMYGFPGKKLLFMGSEFGQRDEWNADQSLDWHLTQFPPHAGLLKWVSDLNRVYRKEGALHQVDFHYAGFEWIDFHDKANSVISFIRKSNDGKENVIVACNFTPVPRPGYRVGVPDAGRYREILNSDSTFYGGSNMGNAGEIQSEPIPYQNRPFSISVNIPPLSAVYLKQG